MYVANANIEGDERMGVKDGLCVYIMNYVMAEEEELEKSSLDIHSIQNLVLSCFNMRILAIPLAPLYPYPWCCSSSHRALQPDAELPLELEPVELRSSKTEISI